MYPVKELNILLNNYCNLRCSYCCFYEVNSNNFREIPLRYVTKAIGLYVEQIQKEQPQNYFLCFNADGESLLSKRLLIAGIEHAIFLKEKFNRKNMNIALVTNGTLVDEELATFFAKHKVMVTVSVDGSAVTHNEHRRDKTGMPSYTKVMQGLEYLQCAGVAISIRAVVTPDTIAKLDEMYYALQKINPVGLIKIRPKREIIIPFYSSTWVEMFTEKVTKGVKKWLKNNISIDQLPDDIYHFAAFILYQKKRQAYCSAGTNMLWLTPLGFFVPCGLLTNSSQVLGHIDNIKNSYDFCKLLEHPLAQNFREKTPSLYKPCCDCEWQEACLGGCPAFNILANKIIIPPLCNYYSRLLATLKKELTL